MSLTVERLTKHFGGVEALTEVDLQIDVGEILGVIGPNGSGKTTLLNVVTGVLRPSGGVARLDGTAVTGRRPHQVARMGLVRTFQNIRLFRDFTLEENVRVAAGINRPGGEAKRRTREILEDLHLGEWADRLAGTLPYGLQRRLEIARALALDPRILLLDEPAAGLNEAESDALMALVNELRDRYECGILIIDHDMRLIMRVCQRLVVLNEGKKIADATPGEVRRDPRVVEAYLG